MPRVAFFGIRVVVHRSREALGELLHVRRDAKILTVRVCRTILVVKGAAGERAEVSGWIGQDGVEGLVLLEDENDRLDLARRGAPTWHDVGVRGRLHLVV